MKNTITLFLFLLAAFFLFSFLMRSQAKTKQVPPLVKNTSLMNTTNGELEVATFGAGCFWCVEAIFDELKGVESVVSGFSGGKVKNPTYKEVISGRTGHAEVTQIKYDPNVITFSELLEVFWSTHDPTTLNRQGNDVGTQYRSAIFYHNAEQKELAQFYLKQLQEQKVFDRPIVTEIVAFEAFYEAENYHQDYFALNPNQGYCRVVIAPKVEKFRKVFKEKLKTSN